MWAEEQLVYVEVRLCNPMTFPVFIKGISLSTSGVPFEAYPTSLTLPPEARGYSVTLSGKPMGNGELLIKGCLVETFNVTYEHAVDAAGKPARAYVAQTAIRRERRTRGERETKRGKERASVREGLREEREQERKREREREQRR